jgi:TRAP-type C4-dicarboxylate transport system substrate-binding protein
MKTSTFRRLATGLLAMAGGWAVAAPAPGGVTLKFATLAPEGSAWMQMFDRMKAKVAEATGGQVKLKAYPAGIMGEEKDVLFKIKVGQVDGGGFLAYGVGAICPESKALTVPLLFDNYEEVDAVFAQMAPYFEERAAQNGYVALGWVEIGFSHLFSAVPVRDLAELRTAKPWAIPGEEMIAELFKAGKVSAIPVPVGDVLTALQTGLIQTVYAPPLATVATQWHTRTRYRNTLRLTYSFGGIFVSRKAWDKVPEAMRAKILEIARAETTALTKQVRLSNDEALGVMDAAKVQKVDTTPEGVAGLRAASQTAVEVMKGKVFPVESYDRIVRHLADHRQARAKGGATP